MITDLDIMAMFATCEAAGLRPPASYAKDQGLAAGIAIYVSDLAHLNPGDLAPAIAKHRRDPERGRWWPTPADILAHVPRAPSLSDHDEGIWDAVIARVAGGRYTFADIPGMEPCHGAALALVGGSWKLRTATEGPELGGMRKRFLASCRASRDRAALQIAAHVEPLQIVDASGRFRGPQ